MTRRRALSAAVQGLGGIAGAAVALPAIGFAVAPIFHRPKETWESVGPTDRFTKDTYLTVVFTQVPGIGEAGKTTAFVRQADPNPPFNEPAGSYVAISSRCAHLGCPVRFVAAAGNFICPCHGGVYDFEGKVIGGPPVRPLDRFYTRINATTGLVEVGPRYSVNSELQRFSPRLPGEPLDGIGQFLYPAQFAGPKKP
jgi:Rieske Fe-S protein